MNDAKFGIFFTIKKHIVPRCVVLVLMFSNDMIYLRPCHGQHLLIVDVLCQFIQFIKKILHQRLYKGNLQCN